MSCLGCQHFISDWLGKLKPNKLSTGCQNELKGAAVEKATNPGRRFLFFSRLHRSFYRASRANFAATPFVRPPRQNRHATQAMVSDKPKLQILIGGLVNWLTDRFGLLVWLVQLDKHRSAKREVQIPASGEKKCCICNTIYKRLDLLAGLSQMSRCLLYAISRWGIEQPRSSFGSISFPFPMKVAVADGGARGDRSPPNYF